MQISLVIPVYDEEASLRALFIEINDILAESAYALWEVIFVDDGSKDSSWSIIRDLTKEYSGRVRGLRHRRNFGKAAALQSGFDLARGDYIITLDADGQDDPKEMLRMIDHLNTGYDLVSGWKAKRHDPFDKIIPSKIFNWVTRTMTGLAIHDFNCGYKVYRKEAAKSLQLYGEMHRFIPVLADANGFMVGELVVNHRERMHGHSKYGWGRLFKGALDLLSVVVSTRYLRRPGHFFGGLGIVFGSIGFFVLSYLSLNKLIFGVGIGSRPLFFLGILLVLFGGQFFSFGLLGELMLRQAPKSPGSLIGERID